MDNRKERIVNGFRRSAWTLAAIGLLGVGSAGAAIVRFELPRYTADLGGILDLNVLIEYDLDDPADDLFSYGLRVEVLTPGATNLIALQLPLKLDYDGINGAPAMTNLSSGVLGAKGTVDLFDTGRSPYAESLLATYRFQFVTEGPVRLQLQPYNTLGPTEDLFVSDGGVVLDDFVVFGSADVDVVPEPAALVMVFSGALALLMARRRN